MFKTARQRAQNWLHELERADKPGLIGRLYRTLRFGYLTVLKFHVDYGFQRAAGLSFSTIISLIPLAVLFFSFAGLLGGGERIIAWVREEVFPLVAPDFKEQLNTWLDTYISPSAFKEGPTGLVNVAAILGLLLAGFGVLVMAERYINHIWEVPAGKRSYLQKLSTFWVVLTVSPLFIALSIGASEWLSGEGSWIGDLQQRFFIVKALYGYLVPIIVGFLGFTTIYLFLPATRVRPISAAIGGLIAAILWEFVRHAFFFYVGRQAAITSFYPKLAVIPLFLIWIYINWVITLLGACAGYVHQNLTLLLRRRAAIHSPQHQSSAALALGYLQQLATAHSNGTAPPLLDDIARTLDTNPDTLLPILRTLQSHSLVAEDAATPNLYFLTRAPSTIRLADIVATLLQADYPLEVPLPHSDPPTHPLTPAWTALLTSFGPRTLADVEESTSIKPTLPSA